MLVVGAGPAGMAAAARAAECGATVGIVDDNADFGGQIWRGGENQDAARWTASLRDERVTKLFQTRVFDQPEKGMLLAESADDLCELRYQNLILATGARERFLPFPGWTLPNVMGAGGLQAMVKSSLPIRGKRVVVAGTGPLLLAVAAYLRKQRRGDSDHLRAGVMGQSGALRRGAVALSGENCARTRVEEGTCGRFLRCELLAAGGAWWRATGKCDDFAKRQGGSHRV